MHHWNFNNSHTGRKGFYGITRKRSTHTQSCAGVEEPRDLIGKRVGLRSFQTTLSVLAKGDLQHEYGVPLDQVTWVTSVEEPVPFDPPPGVRIERAPRGRNIETMLVEGEIQAYMVPRMPRPFVQGARQVARLFQDPRVEEPAYYRRKEYFPRNCWAAVEGSEPEIKSTARLIGADRMCISTDYPHFASNFPNVSTNLLNNVPRDMAAQIVMGGARALRPSSARTSSRRSSIWWEKRT